MRYEVIFIGSSGERNPLASWVLLRAASCVPFGLAGSVGLCRCKPLQAAIPSTSQALATGGLSMVMTADLSGSPATYPYIGKIGRGGAGWLLAICEQTGCKLWVIDRGHSMCGWRWPIWGCGTSFVLFCLSAHGIDGRQVSSGTPSASLEVEVSVCESTSRAIPIWRRKAWAAW
ncbi:uncharacterized protein LY79DRAFT_541069 [Colletotrichum navitas]|uniref:Uncharacterized protein n=1 Tax=Colletotrichum navitas TaxID=681940 RepID=A0AAD8QA21_9PEZI|nr:uncharacterized protein LY79DRAFT_541069 [Colletotrichum navitas]KAK1597777.1 hypothetical protein LY79DRAFT_541069 [Colletotrichum navitas]